MRNILAENLLRFGVKNLSEADKQKVQEQFEPGETQEAFDNVPLTIRLPYKKDTNGQLSIFDSTKPINVIATNQKGTHGNSLDAYSQITRLDFAGYGAVQVNSKKDSDTNISGRFVIGNNTKLKSYLQSMAGKTLSAAAAKTMLVDLTKVAGGTASVPAGGTSFQIYEIPVTAPSKMQ